MLNTIIIDEINQNQIKYLLEEKEDIKMIENIIKKTLEQEDDELLAEQLMPLILMLQKTNGIYSSLNKCILHTVF